MRIIKEKKLQLIIFIILSFFILFLFSACSDNVNSSRGFTLPQGDAKKGKMVFLDHRCLACHTLTGLDDPSVKIILPEPVVLGGKVTRIKTYADLVTSVINPSHRIANLHQSSNYKADGTSTMENYNDVMTISELTDLVTFLQPYYRVVKFKHTHYDIYP